jgi:hypothetical protein
MLLLTEFKRFLDLPRLEVAWFPNRARWSQWMFSSNPVQTLLESELFINGIDYFINGINDAIHPENNWFNKTNEPHAQNASFHHCSSMPKTIDCTQKIPYPKFSGKQVLNIPINGDQSRSMATQLLRNWFN